MVLTHSKAPEREAWSAPLRGRKWAEAQEVSIMVARQFSKPQPARQLEARARARTLGVRVAVVVEARRYVTHAQSQRGVTYTVERTPVGWACECLGFYHTGVCKHVAAVQRRSER